MRVLLLTLVSLMAFGDVLEATDADTVSQFLTKNDNSVASLLFHTPKSSGLFTLFGLFSKEETDSDFMKRVAENSHMMKVDVTNPALQDTVERYHVDETPWIVVQDKGKIEISEKPGPDTEAKILKLVEAHLPVEKTGAPVKSEIKPTVTNVSPVALPEKKVTPAPTQTVTQQVHAPRTQVVEAPTTISIPR